MLNYEQPKKPSFLAKGFHYLCLAIALLCIIYIWKWNIQNKETEKILSSIDEAIVEQEEQTIIIGISADTGESQIVSSSSEQIEDGTGTTVTEPSSTVSITTFQIDFQRLKNENPDTVGVLKLNGTDIRYPVVQASNNEYYINHSFDKSSNNAGWIFVNAANRLDGTDKNITVFGHNRKDDSMFGTLKNALTKDWYSNVVNRYILWQDVNGEKVYEIFSVYQIKVEEYYMQNDFSSDSEYMTFLNTMKKRSVHSFETTLNPSDQILTLSTCSTGDNRTVLHAKLMK